jgi:hypothetical protein
VVVVNARHLVSQLVKQVVVLQISLVKTQKNNENAVKMPPHMTAFFYVKIYVAKEKLFWYISIN